MRKFLWASLALAPITIVVQHATDISDTALFILAAVALVPLAWLIGESTEHAAEHTGPRIGGFLNATFGNAPELIIALLAVSDGLFEVVRGSLTGSVVGNLLLVLGFSLVAGGDGAIDRKSSFTSLGLVLFAVLLFLVPAVPGFDGDPNRHDLAVLSLPVAIVLLCVYSAVTWRSLSAAGHTEAQEAHAPAGGWSLPLSLAVLGVTTVFTALVAEAVVHTIDHFAESAGLSDFFVAAVIVAIVGNAAEHGGAVVVAGRGKIKLATEIALSSSAQVAVFLIPAVAILSWAIKPLSLAFRPIELAAVAGSTLLAGVLLREGRSSRWRGAVLVAAYAGVAVGFWAAGDR